MELVCIVCPVSCNLEVVMEDGKIKEIKGPAAKESNMQKKRPFVPKDSYHYHKNN